MLARITNFFRAQQHGLYWVGLPLLAAVLSTVLADALVGSFDRVNEVEADLNVRLRQFRPPEPNPAISMIVFDESSISRLPIWNGGISRSNFATLIRKLKKAGTKALLVDLVFKDPRGSDDVELIKALHEPSQMGITLASTLPVEPELDEREVDGQRWTHASLDHLKVPKGSDHLRIASNTSLRHPLNAVGGVVYRYDRERKFWLQHVALSVVLQYLGISESQIRFDQESGHWSAGGLEWELQGNNAVLIQWTDDVDSFPRHDLADVLLDYSPDELAKKFKGKLVILGMIVQSIDVIETAPGRIHGVEFISQLVNTIMLAPSARITDPDRFWLLTWCLALGSAACLAGLYTRISWSTFGLFATGLLAVAMPDLVARSFGMAMETVAPALAVLFCFLMGTLARVWVPKPGRPTGNEFEAMAMFFDLRGSTQLLRELGAQEYRKLYSEISTQIARIVDRFGGHVERTTGDGALIIFPATKRVPHAASAARAIRPIVESIAELARNRGVELGVTIGMESGVLTGGYVVEGGRRTWSSAGTAINLARRLQEATDGLRIDVAIGPVAARQMEGSVKLEKVGEIDAQGFDGKICVWTRVEEER